jgi:hypothetical protein
VPVTIKNLTRSPLFVPLNSGIHIRLSPGASTQDVNEVELKDNAKITKLLDRRSLAVIQPTAPAVSGTGAAAAAAGSSPTPAAAASAQGTVEAATQPTESPLTAASDTATKSTPKR